MGRVFISFNYSDSAMKKTVDNWKNQEIGTDISFTSLDGHSYSDRGDAHVEQLLSSYIAKSHIVLVLVGNNTHNSQWVKYEIAEAKRLGKTLLWTQLPGATGGAPRELMQERCLPFDMREIQWQIRQIR